MCIKDGSINITFAEAEVEKHKCHWNKGPIFLVDIDIDNVLRFLLVKKARNNLFITCMMIIQLCWPK